MALFYVYPKWHVVSFTVIAEKHLKYLRRYVNVYDIDEKEWSRILWSVKHNFLIHPIMYPIISKFIDPERLRKCSNKLGGFEVADSDRISEYAVNIINMFDLVIVPSTFAKKVFQESGVKTNIEVLPHGIDDEFVRPKNFPTNPDIMRVRLANGVKVLFFLWHSGERKGADLVFEVMRYVQRKRPDTILVLKTWNPCGYHYMLLKRLRHIEVNGFLSEKDLVDLYDSCDILLCFSRGGGFELNVLEALARGLVVLVPEQGSWIDYAKDSVLIKVARKVKVYNDNPVHVGYGFEIDVNDAIEKLIHVIDHIKEYKERFARIRKYIIENYHWSKIVEKLVDILDKYGFLEGIS